MRKVFTVIALLGFTIAQAQLADHVYSPTIKTVKLATGDPLELPIIELGSQGGLQLNFDDMAFEVRNYFYTIQLCNADWTPVNINTINYLKGFSENRIVNYKFSSVALQKYVHYQLNFPNANCTPIMAGNYIMKVYENSDTNQVAFTRRFMVINQKISMAGRISQPINPKILYTSQKVNVSVNTKGLNIQNPFDQVKIVILQNARWDNAVSNIKPRFIKGDILEYDAENDCIFPGMKEWRWLDLRSLRLQTERVARANYGRTGTEVFVTPDLPRDNTPYMYIKDINGRFFNATLDGYDPNYEGDYAQVHFTFPSKEPYPGYDMYIFGEVTGYECSDANKMTYNGQKQAYEGLLFLKQGYYNYVYAMVDRTNGQFTTELTEGNSWETENEYTVLMYFRALGGRHDELLGTMKLNSLTSRR